MVSYLGSHIYLWSHIYGLISGVLYPGSDCIRTTDKESVTTVLMH